MATHGLKNWVSKLQNQNLPVLGNVISELNKITGSDDSNVNQLAEVILKDPNLTSHVLRVANSVQYNYSKGQINTVSRAIVNIGLKGVRAICISSMVMEALLKDEPKARVLELVAQGFHAAIQAKNLALGADESDSEEVFIAGLLYNLGEMAFWLTEEVGNGNADLMSDSPKARKEAMEAILGTSFKAITRELARHWRLGETLESALSSSAAPSKKVKAVIIGERVSRAAIYGWDSPQLKKVLAEVAEYSGKSLEDALKMVKEGGDQAAAAALSYGVSEACPLIPGSLESKAIARPEASDKVLKGDASLQLSILRELACATNEQLDVSTIFQMVLEGMHRGIGLERVCVAFIQGHRLLAKYVLGEGADHWRTRFQMDIGPYTDSIFTHTLEQGGGHWFTDETIARSANLYPADLVTVVGKFPSFTYLIEVKGRKVAVFYADRFSYGGRLSEDLFESFKHFATQAQMSLNVLAQKSAAR